MANEVTVLRAPARLTLAEIEARLRGPLAEAGAERAIVFGSWARGTADAWSDLDLVVVLETSLPRAERWRLLARALDALPIPVDLLVYTPAEFARGVAGGRGVFDALAREGVTIHARSPR